MSTYKIDRSNSLQYTGKFKFDYQVNIVPGDLISSRGTGIYQGISAGAYPAFTLKSVSCSIYVGEKPSTSVGPGATPGNHPWPDQGGLYNFGNFIDGGRHVLKIPVTFFIQSPGALIADDVFYKSYSETIILYTEPYDPDIKPNKTLGGSIEGEFFVGLGTNEFVDIDEYYPSENYFIGSPVCPDNDDEYWKNKELDKDTIRQWPKYTSLNWYEAIDPQSKSYVGLKIKFTNPKGQLTTFTKVFEIPNPSQLDIEIEDRKFINAWTTTSSNSGYVSISSNVPVDAGDPDFVRKDHAQTDTQNYYLQPFPGATRTDDPKCTAKISLNSVSFILKTNKI